MVGIKVTRAITRVVGDRRKFRGKGRVKSYAIKLSTSSARHNRDLRKLAGLWGKFGRKKIVKVQLLKGISTRALPLSFFTAPFAKRSNSRPPHSNLLRRRRREKIVNNHDQTRQRGKKERSRGKIVGEYIRGRSSVEKRGFQRTRVAGDFSTYEDA